MKKQHLIVIVLGIYFLFLVQLAGTLVESIYILDLMNTSLDEKALGLFFFFSPVVLFLYRGKRPAITAWGSVGILLVARGLTPYLPTLGRMLAAGIGTGAALVLLPFLLTAETAVGRTAQWISPGLALGVGLSILLRTVGCGLDYSLLLEGGWAGWILGLGLGVGTTLFNWPQTRHSSSAVLKVLIPAVGVLLVIGLAWFAFSAPAVIARWTESDYRLVVISISFLTLAAGWLLLVKPDWIKRISPAWILTWNLVFTTALTLTILAHRVSFPAVPGAAPVVVGSPAWLAQVPLALCLISFPVIFLDLRLISDRIQGAEPAIRDLVPGILLGSLLLVLMVFMQIFSNVWGYVEPVSLWFRNKFWLPFSLLAGLTTILIGQRGKPAGRDRPLAAGDHSWVLLGLLSVTFLGTAMGVTLTAVPGDFEPRDGSFLVMTYNIQQANDHAGERSYREQLALIESLAPDILALQESDSARVSLNNNDYVRYFASRLGYYSYYGPRTVTGTYGTAILSKYPLRNTRSIFSFSDQDEIGTALAEVQINGVTITIYNVHPDGSDTAMRVWAETILEQSRGKPYQVILGDFNLRDYEAAYQLIADEYTNVWESVYPSKISPDGTDMSGENRIDHIFISADLSARDPVYLLPPQSATDHPVHWAEITWE